MEGFVGPQKTRLGLECDHKQTENAQQATSFLFHRADVSSWLLCPQMYPSTPPVIPFHTRIFCTPPY